MNADLRFAGDSLAVRDVTVNTLDGQRRGHATLRGWLTFADFRTRASISLFPQSTCTLSATRDSPTWCYLRPQPAIRSICAGSFRPPSYPAAYWSIAARLTFPDILQQKKIVSLADPQLYDLVDTSPLREPVAVAVGALATPVRIYVRQRASRSRIGCLAQLRRSQHQPDYRGPAAGRDDRANGTGLVEGARVDRYSRRKSGHLSAQPGSRATHLYSGLWDGSVPSATPTTTPT